MKKSTIAKILGVTAAIAGGAAFINSDDERVTHFREKLGSSVGGFLGTAGGAALRAYSGSDISFKPGEGLKITPHSAAKSLEEKVPEKLDGVVSPADWNRMTYSSQQSYMSMLERQHRHELELKRLEVEKAKADMAASDVKISTVEEKNEPSSGTTSAE